jgi:Tfp pilus assembly protein PilZ
MEEELTPPQAERRITARIPTRSLVEVRIPDWSALRTVYTVNLSIGGMRLSLGARAAMGAPVDIILTLPNGERLRLPGTVAHLGPGGSGDVGVRFDELPANTNQQIQGYLDRLAAGETPDTKSRTKSIPPGVLIKKKS